MRYREIRDKHLILTFIHSLKVILYNRISLEYSEMSEVIKMLAAVSVVAEHRGNVWQRICLDEVNIYCFKADFFNFVYFPSMVVF